MKKKRQNYRYNPVSKPCAPTIFSVQGVFHSMDKNRNGVLSMAELENVFNLMGITDNKTVKAITAQWDEAGNGNVSFQDFVK